MFGIFKTPKTVPEPLEDMDFSTKSSAKFLPEDLFIIKGRGAVVTGTVMQGDITPDMSLSINGAKYKITNIEQYRKSGIKRAGQGEQIGIMASGISEDVIDSCIKSKTTIDVVY